MLIEVTPFVSMLNQIVGSNRGPSVALKGSGRGRKLAAFAGAANPNAAPAAILEIRKLLRESTSSSLCRSGLFMIHLPDRHGSGGLDGGEDARVRHATAQVSSHHRVDVRV